MSEEIVANFELNNVELTAEMELSEGAQFDTVFTIDAAPEKVSQLENDLNYQTQEQVQESIQAESDIINARIDDEVERLEDEIEQSVVDIQGSALIDADRVEHTVTLSSKTFIFEQGIPATEWVINHNLNKRPSIELADYNGQRFEAYREYTNDNQVIIRLDSAGTGYAYLN